ncbi:MAG: sugar porter family MFS transporter [Bacteroidales bacterium]
MIKDNRKYNLKFLMRVSMVTAMGGLLFGYDWVVIGGAKPFYEPYFGISSSPALQGWVMSCALVGCLCGALISGWLSDRFGRKKLLILSAALFMIASAGTGAAYSLPMFVIFRITGGIGIGLASNLSPMYIAEITPSRARGAFVSINQLTIVIGILMAQIVNWLIAQPVPAGSGIEDILASWNGQWGWRWMFFACAVPASLFFLLMWFVPESPRWLARDNKNKQKVLGLLTKIGGKEFAIQEQNAIEETLLVEKDKTRFSGLFARGTRNLLLIGVILAIYQQWCGINVIFNYAQEIFSSAGYTVSDILFNIVITGTVNLVFTFVGMFTVDRLGRKALMLIGAGGLALLFATLGLMYFTGMHGLPLLIMVVVSIACYATTLGPVTWVLLSEIFPNRARGTMMSVATFSLWAACFVLTYTFPVLNKTLEASGTFWLYSLISVGGFFFILARLPETKGKSLEEIEHRLSGN